MPSIDFFLLSKRKTLLPNTIIIDIEISALVRLSFCENLFIGLKTSVHCKRVEFRDNVGAFPKDKENFP